MPKRTDINSILIIGSGPIVIGQACEFDYSGTQAIKALKEEGYRVVLVNSNPATIMTDPNFADKTYIEPITADYVEKIIEKERPDAVLPTMGGQTALNTALELEERGVFEKYNCELIGAKVDSIKTAEDRELFRQAMDEIGLRSAKSVLVRTIDDAQSCVEQLGFPLILRPSRTLGGTGGGIVENADELNDKINKALTASPNSEVLVEKSLLGWKEIELEVMRDKKDNVVIVCAIENIDPMGVHTGDSITVAPVQTLTDKEYQLLRDASIKIIRKIGVETGGSNVQFAMNPENGEIVVIEMNPRVSRSSALASKATGFPIAKIAAKLAIGYTLDEISNDITKETPACFEPTIDYVVVKIPRFNFEKFPNARNELGTQMKSVGEALAFGRNFSEALQKAMCSLEMDSFGFDSVSQYSGMSDEDLLTVCRRPHSTRLWAVGEALRRDISVDRLYETTKIDHWFLAEIKSIIDTEEEIKQDKDAVFDKTVMYDLKRMGFSDKRISVLTGQPEDKICDYRLKNGIVPSYLTIDTCAGEFKAATPYLYSAYERVKRNDSAKLGKSPVIILGSGPNRIGQGIEFDYCCVQAVFALKEAGIPAIMVNSNPETVSTDYDISDKLYFEPLTFESVMSIVREESPRGVILQFGGQTPLKLAKQLQQAGVPILGTSVESIDRAEDRREFNELIETLKLQQPEGALATSVEEAVACGNQIGYPVLMRPSFVLGGRAMRIVHSEEELKKYIAESVAASSIDSLQKKPVLIDKYLNNAIEVDVDAVSDGDNVVIAGIMEHIEKAGVHSGDSSCVLPPFSLTKSVIAKLEQQAVQLAKALKVIGLLNVQFAVTQDEEIYVLEANPRASRTVPFVSKATGIAWAKIATILMTGKSLADQNITKSVIPDYFSVKACVFPFSKFPGVDIILGPEMKSTGEVMGIGDSFAAGFAKSQFAVNTKLPKQGNVFVSVMDRDKTEILAAVIKLCSLGFGIYATSGTADFLEKNGIKAIKVKKVREGSPHVVDLLKAGMIQMVINTPEGSQHFLDSRSIRLSSMELGIPTYTTVAAAVSAVEALQKIINNQVHEVKAIQEYHESLN